MKISRQVIIFHAKEIYFMKNTFGVFLFSTSVTSYNILIFFVLINSFPQTNVASKNLYLEISL